MVVEEFHITKRQVQTQVNQPVTLLKEEVKVDHQDMKRPITNRL